MNQPASASPSCNSTTTPTGRPPMWSPSAQRKMARLYVYTTLPLETIVRLIHARSPEATPGIDSANKKLNGLLDKEPRWLHPRNESDMGRRVAQLSMSAIRLASASNPPFEPSNPVQNDTPRLSPSSDGDSKRETGASPAFADAISLERSSPVAQGQLGDALSLKSPAAWSIGNASCQLETHFGSQPEDIGASYDQNGVFSPFLRKTSFSSVSSDTSSNGSFCEILDGYSRPYIETVKRLVKRFTAPTGNRPDLSPDAGDSDAQANWAEKGPRPFESEPFPLPGDFLSLDLWAQNQQCHALAEAHEQRRCLCYAQFDGFVSPWVADLDLTPLGHRMLVMGPLPKDVEDMDSSGNTVLHLLAARSSIRLLIHVLQTDMYDSVLHAKNTAGQTFLHVLNRVEVCRADMMCRLLQVVADKGFNVYALDVYGRSVFHMLHLSELTWEQISHICHRFDGPVLNRRDAFGLIPKSGPAKTGETRGKERAAARRGNSGNAHESIDVDTAPSSAEAVSPTLSDSDPGIAREARLLEHIRLAQVQPQLEDVEGGNGLHSLAEATLSSGSMTQKYRLESRRSSKRSAVFRSSTASAIGSPSTSAGAGTSSSYRCTHKPVGDKLLDSSSARLEFRLGLAAGLLDAGADVNHHDLRGNTPLMAFCAQLPEENDYKTGPRILGLLVTRGANVHARNRAGETALHVAVRCGRKLAAKTLVQHGASVYARDAAGRSVLDVADECLATCGRWGEPRHYAHLEACRAWLSSAKGLAEQQPTVLHEWGLK